MAEDSTCPLCAPERPPAHTLLEGDGHRLLRCDGCGLIRLGQLLAPDGVDAIVQEPNYHYGGEIDWKADLTEEALASTLAYRNAQASHRRLQAAIARFAPSRERPLRVHDIGCSEGFSLLFGRRAGWDCSGNDLSALRRDFGRRNLKVDFPLGTFGELPATEYDVIALRHVLEHLPEPLKELQLVHERLGVGGLLIVEVPNFAAPSLRLKTFRQRVGLRRGSLGFLGVPEHQWQFTAGTLGRILERGGFAVRSMGTTSRATNHGVVATWFLTATVHAARWGSYLFAVAERR
jgi:SAM-dependent methyltransferase